MKQFYYSVDYFPLLVNTSCVFLYSGLRSVVVFPAGQFEKQKESL